MSLPGITSLGERSRGGSPRRRGARAGAGSRPPSISGPSRTKVAIATRLLHHRLEFRQRGLEVGALVPSAPRTRAARRPRHATRCPGDCTPARAEATSAPKGAARDPLTTAARAAAVGRAGAMAAARWGGSGTAGLSRGGDTSGLCQRGDQIGRGAKAAGSPAAPPPRRDGGRASATARRAQWPGTTALSQAPPRRLAPRTGAARPAPACSRAPGSWLARS